jgi:LCCL domain/Carboxypeptidase regulatory-like domain
VARVDASSASVPALPLPSAPPLPALIVSAVPNAPPNAGVVVNGLPFTLDEQSLWQLLGGQPTAGRTGSPQLVALRNHNGESFEFEVTGTNSGSIWGDGIYTDDSNLGVAAVHAGALRVGERGRVRITMLPGRSSYDGATRNGIASRTYNAWQGSYRVDIPTSRTPPPTAASLASIGGRILDSNQRALRGVTVTASGPQTYATTTNAEGDYLITGVLSGNYLMTAGGASIATAAGRGGTFRLPVLEGEYRFSVGALPMGLTVKSLSFGSMDLLGGALKLDGAVAPSEIRLVLGKR